MNLNIFTSFPRFHIFLRKVSHVILLVEVHFFRVCTKRPMSQSAPCHNAPHFTMRPMSQSNPCPRATHVTKRPICNKATHVTMPPTLQRDPFGSVHITKRPIQPCLQIDPQTKRPTTQSNPRHRGTHVRRQPMKEGFFLHIENACEEIKILSIRSTRIFYSTLYRKNFHLFEEIKILSIRSTRIFFSTLYRKDFHLFEGIFDNQSHNG